MNHEKLKIREYQHWTVYLYGNQYYLGRVYLWAKRQGALDLIETSPEERAEFFEIGRAIKIALEDLFQPDLFNYAAFGNVAPHLHIHIIPRYSLPRVFDNVRFVDERWGKNYAPYDKDFSIAEETLLKLRETLQEKLNPEHF